MRTTWAVLLIVSVATLGARVAAADPAGDADAAFAAYVGGLAAGSAGSADSVITPFFNDGEGVGSDQLADLAKIKLGKVSGVSTVVSPGGKSAWLVADVARKKGSALRATAVLAADDTGWHVVAAHLSIATPHVKTGDCGALTFEWDLTADVDKAAEPAVAAVAGALDAHRLADIVSDDKHAVAIGSAAKERWTGGAAIKPEVKKLGVGIALGTGDKPRAIAGVTPDGQLAYVTMAVDAPSAYCTQYRAQFVLATDKAGWRVASQHYSERVRSPE
jgi:hypothetical protein|nr:nuclear transport factor 2 family protein [Kofleriaceae bacterium]